MKRMFIAAAILTTCALAHQNGEKANLGIFVETRLTRIAGMPVRKMPDLSGLKGLGSRFKIPGMSNLVLPGTPSRGLTVRLWSPNVAPDDATASLAIPAGLNLGDKLDLDIFRPQPIQPAPTQPTSQPTEPTAATKIPDFTIKIYWGSSDTVQPGQPKIFNLADMMGSSQGMISAMMAQARTVQSRGGGGGGGGLYKEMGSTAFWPGKTSASPIKEDAALPGTYTLATSYTGGTTIDAPSDVNFLAPIEITAPDLDQKVPMDGALAFQWNPIPNCLGLYASAFGMEDKNTMIIWTSASDYAEKIIGDMNYLQMADVKKNVGNKVFMGGDSTSVTIPSGIFANCNLAGFNMVGYGPGAASTGGDLAARIQTKTNISVMMLAGKMGKPASPAGGNN